MLKKFVRISVILCGVTVLFAIYIHSLVPSTMYFAEGEKVQIKSLPMVSLGQKLSFGSRSVQSADQPLQYTARLFGVVPLKTVNVSYTFDFTNLRRSFVRSLTLGLTGENLWLWTRYNGFDPDVSSSGDTSTIRRADIGAYPRARQIVANLQIRF